jgi:hypothetical protein
MGLSKREVARLPNDGGGATKCSALVEKGRKRMSAEDCFFLLTFSPDVAWEGR